MGLVLAGWSDGTAKVRTIAVTVDDLPGVAALSGNCDETSFQELNKRLLKQFDEARVPVTGFVTEHRVCDRRRPELLPELLHAWLDAGHTLGNHTFSHLDINRTPLADYKKDIIRGERFTQQVLKERGERLVYFRHPLLHTGSGGETRRELDRFLTERNYTVAPVTIDNQEFVFANVYVRAKKRGDRETMKRVAEAYVPFMESVLEFFERYSVKVVGYEPSQVLLIHANELNADHFGTLASMMRRRGYQFISLDEALADDAYRLPDGYIGMKGLSWIHRWAVAKGMELEEEPREPEWLADLNRNY
jgi:peptidoglycan/xylan/chitin deacetylase (PgdA/CDA1 family)